MNHPKPLAASEPMQDRVDAAAQSDEARVDQALAALALAPMRLVRPARLHLASYAAALAQGWSSDMRGAPAAAQEHERLMRDPDALLAQQIDLQARGAPVALPDGSTVERLPSLRLWMWDGAFCGTIQLRWQPGTTALPPHCLGHIGYVVVPWKQRQGHATAALAQMLTVTRAMKLGLAHVTLTTDRDNRPSQRVIEANGGVLQEAFIKPQQFGATPGLRYRVELV